MDAIKKYAKYYMIYTVLFLLAVPAVFSAYIAGGKGLIYSSDGLRQHYVALVYLGQWGREILKNILFRHTFEIPLWNFNIGYGADIITTFHYYVLGDPLNLLSIFVAPKYTEYLYGFLILLRIYLSGISFSCYCFCMKKSKKSALIGAFCYIFCGYMLHAGTRHPFFANPMIYLPLLFVGAERIFRRKKPGLFIFMVCLSAVSNFYFFYMLALGVCFYVAVRFFTFPHTHIFKEMAFVILRFAGYAIVGVCMSAPILLPVLIQFSGSGRTAEKPLYAMLYDPSYYQYFLRTFISAKGLSVGYAWTLLGFAFPALFGILFLFARKKHAALKISFLLTTGMLMFPFFGSAMNGFSYVANRWCFMYAFLVIFIFVTAWDDAMRLCKKYSPRVLSCCLLAAALLHICLNGYGLFGPDGKNLASKFSESGTALGKIMATAPEAVKRAAPQEEDFCRLEMDSFDMLNTAVPIGVNGIQFYWSLETPNIAQYLKEMALKNFISFHYRDLDHRTFLDALAGVKYFARKDSNYMPYGYRLIDAVSLGPGKVFEIYENQYALPLAYSYESQIPYETYEQLPPQKRQQALLQGIVLDKAEKNPPSDIPETELAYTDQSVNYTLSSGKDISIKQGSCFEVKEKGAELTLSFQGLSNSETYLFLTGTQISADNAKDEFYIDVSSDESNNRMRYMTPYHKCYIGQKDYLVNLGYHKNAQTQITIRFLRKGTYQFKDIQVLCQPMDEYPGQVGALKKDALQEISIGTDTVAGRVSMEKDKILCFSIPYSTGWRAVVDGKEQPLLKANTMYMALPLAKGTHEILLRYRTPGLYAGICLGCIGLAAFISLTVKKKPKRIRRQTMRNTA